MARFHEVISSNSVDLKGILTDRFSINPLQQPDVCISALQYLFALLSADFRAVSHDVRADTRKLNIAVQNKNMALRVKPKYENKSDKLTSVQQLASRVTCCEHPRVMID